MRENTDQKNSKYGHISRSVAQATEAFCFEVGKKTFNDKKVIWLKTKAIFMFLKNHVHKYNTIQNHLSFNRKVEYIKEKILNTKKT